MAASVLVSNLGKRFGRVVALDGVSLEVHGGQVAIILGANGSGKSTLLRAIAGMLTPDAGTVVVGGHDIARQRRRASALVGSSIDSARCWYPRLSGRANLEFHACVRGLPRARAAAEAARELAAVGLAGDADLRVAGYSTGMRARLALARARLGSPPIVVLDEPTASLDARSAEELRERIRTEEREGAVVIATHDLDEAALLGTHATVLRSGRVAGRVGAELSASVLRAAVEAG